MLNLFAYVIPYQQLAMMAKPTYSENGKFEDGGFDLTLMEFVGYLHDVIYITGFVQLTTIISEKFWYIYLVGPEDDEKSRKNREKMERKASKPKFVQTRN
ncbi:unnamed protein product [Camellia sinensis]